MLNDTDKLLVTTLTIWMKEETWLDLNLYILYFTNSKISYQSTNKKQNQVWNVIDFFK